MSKEGKTMIDKKDFHLLVPTVDERNAIINKLDELHIAWDDDGGGDYYFKMQVGNTVNKINLHCKECMDEVEFYAFLTYYGRHSEFVVHTFEDIENLIK